MNHCVLAVAFGLVGSAAARAADPPSVTPVTSLLAEHCTDCHGGAKPKAGLDLTTLRPTFDDPTAFAAWARVRDELATGRMPPKGRDRPDPAAVAKAVASLHAELQTASAARQAAGGRVPVRRLNRTEFGNALRDLLGITATFDDLLPEDAVASGFDTVAAGLDTSATHLVRYQQAVDRALAAAVPTGPVTPIRSRMTGKEFVGWRPKPNRDGLMPFIRFDGDAVVVYANVYKHMGPQTVAAPVAGRYRFRAAVRAVNTGGKPLPVLFGRISSDRFDHEKLKHIFDVRDAAADKATVVEFETPLPAGEQVYVAAWSRLQEMGAFLKELTPPMPRPGLAVEWLELEGPLEPEAGRRLLFGDATWEPREWAGKNVPGKPTAGDWAKWHPNEFDKYPRTLVPVSTDPKADADRLIRAFLPKAFRRPVPAELADQYVWLVHDQLAAKADYRDAMLAAYKAILCSPHFLMRVEKPGPLDDHAIATRLSLFLWSSIPDADLLAVASKGGLRRPELLRAQVERMLADPKSKRFTANFAGQWLEVRKVNDMKPDVIYGEYDDTLAWAAPRETERFFEAVLARDRPVTEFVHSDWAVLNERLAMHYGVPGVSGFDFREVPLKPEYHRGGVLTQAGVLKVTTNATYTSPVKRGAWVLDRILGTPPKPPPSDVPAVEPDIRGAVTLREQLAKHKSLGACATCHAAIDPPGFALESYDVVGGWREFYRVKTGGDGNRYVDLPNYPGRKAWLAKPVDPSAATADGKAFQDIEGYKKIVLADPNQLTRNLARKLLVYGTGADIQYADRDVVERIVARVRAKGYGFRSLIHEVVQSPVFLSK